MSRTTHKRNEVTIKLHEDLMEHAQTKAAADYCTIAEYVRRLIIADMRSHTPEGNTRPRKKAKP